MRAANIVENSGIVRRITDGIALGSCFLFRHVNIVLTADHVVKKFLNEGLCVEFPNSRAADTRFAVKKIESHPEADLAIIEINPPNEWDVTWLQTETRNDLAYGLPVFSFGFSQDWNATGPVSVDRLFKGHIQRTLEHKSHLGYKYLAVELSFPCPLGLSGSALTNPDFQGRLYGVITENRESATEVSSSEYIETGGTSVRETTRNFVSYGLALWLPSVGDWIDSIVPPVPEEEITRRANNQQRWRIQQADQKQE